MENKKFNIKYLDIVEDNRKSHCWYGGDVVEIEYDDNIKLVISAIGDIIGDIYDKNGENVAHFKDKRNGGGFYTVASEYFKNDEELEKASFSYKPSEEEINGLDYYVMFDYCNWWEVFPVINGEWHDIMMCLDASNIDDAIKDVADNIDTILEDLI